MNIIAVKTHKVTSKDKDLFKILDEYLSKLKDKSIVAITSKIVSITEGRIVKIGDVDKDKLIGQESQFFLPRESNPYKVSLTIAHDTLVATAGIDESNGNGYYILWPKDSQATANKVRAYLQGKFNRKHIGVIITDSKTTPLRWGVTAIAIAYSGFSPVKNYVGTKDIFGREFQFEKLNIADCLASSAALVMGEGGEQTPIAVIEDVPFVKFTNRNPSLRELTSLRIKPEEDLYWPLLKAAKWKKGKNIKV